MAFVDTLQVKAVEAILSAIDHALPASPWLGREREFGGE